MSKPRSAPRPKPEPVGDVNAALEEESLRRNLAGILALAVERFAAGQLTLDALRDVVDNLEEMERTLSGVGPGGDEAQGCRDAELVAVLSARPLPPNDVAGKVGYLEGIIAAVRARDARAKGAT